MTTKKPLVWIALATVLLATTLVFIFTRTKPEVQEVPEPDAFRLSTAQLSKYLDGEISRYLPIEKLDVAFFEDGTINLGAVFKREDLYKLLEKKQPSLKYAAKLLPEQIDTHLALRILLGEKSLSVEPIAFKVASFDLTSWISQDMVDSFNRKIAQYFSERQIELLSLSVLPDAISMEIRRNFT